MPEHFYREVLLKGNGIRRYRLTVEFQDAALAPLGLFLTAEARSFYAELKDILKEVREGQQPVEFSGNLGRVVISPETTVVTVPGQAEDEEKSCEIATADFASLLEEFHERATK
ncbi:MAG: hypothetical protein IKQ96_03510 [Lachnospiraceae bacterium]|nr:hypothetical protein [Lachnospiraceae bacterium]